MSLGRKREYRKLMFGTRRVLRINTDGIVFDKFELPINDESDRRGKFQVGCNLMKPINTRGFKTNIPNTRRFVSKHNRIASPGSCFYWIGDKIPENQLIQTLIGINLWYEQSKIVYIAKNNNCLSDSISKNNKAIIDYVKSNAVSKFQGFTDKVYTHYENIEEYI